MGYTFISNILRVGKEMSTIKQDSVIYAVGGDQWAKAVNRIGRMQVYRRCNIIESLKA